MTITLRQKIAISIIRLGILFVWFIDSLSLRHLLAGALTTFVLLYLPSGIAKVPKLDNGIVFSIYGDPSNLQSITGKNVLGAATKKVEKPVFLNSSTVPYITARSYLVAEKSSAKILAEHNLNERLAPASTTKLLTALVAMDLYNLDDSIRVPADCLTIDTTKLWLPEVANFKVSDLLTSVLVSSAGDSACALSTVKISYTDFVEKMNALAQKLGMVDSYFTNPIGLDGYANSHYSTAKDLFLLARAATKNDFIKNAVATKSYGLHSTDGNFNLKINNTNRLLWEQPNSVGIKTGTTVEAGEVLIYEFNDNVKDLIIVVMGSSDRFTDTKALLNWTLSNYSWE